MKLSLMDKKVVMNKLNKMILWVFSLLALSGCGDDDLAKRKNAEIDRLKSEKISLSTELDSVKKSLEAAEEKAKQEAQKTIDDLTQTIEQLKKEQSQDAQKTEK
jgi:outer membrane murein-binding lipoprotein Lpp